MQFVAGSPPNRASKRFLENAPGLILTVIGIVQALVFQQLVQKAPYILLHPRDIVVLAHWVLAFAVLLRIFQTYVTAALHYETLVYHLIDILVIFGLGVLQYLAYEALPNQGGKLNPVGYHLPLAILTGVGLFGYVRMLCRLPESGTRPIGERERERVLQYGNILGTSVVCAASLSALWIRGAYLLIPVLVSTAAVLANMSLSIRMTFSTPDFTTAIADEPVASLPTPNTAALVSEAVVVPVSRAHVEAVVDFVCRHRSRYFGELTGVSNSQVRQIIGLIIADRDGAGPMGFQTMHVVLHEETTSVLGLAVEGGYFSPAKRNRLRSLLRPYLGARLLDRVEKKLVALGFVLNIPTRDTFRIPLMAVADGGAEEQVCNLLVRELRVVAKSVGATSIFVHTAVSDAVGAIVSSLPQAQPEADSEGRELGYLLPLT